MENIAAGAGSLGVDAIFQYTGTGAQFLFGTLFYFVLVRLFSEQVVGTIVIFVAISGLFNIAFSLGLGAAAKHFISFYIGKNDYASAKRIIYRLIGFGFLGSLTGLVCLVMSAPLLSETFFHSTFEVSYIRLLGAVVIGNIMFSVLNGTILGLQRFRTGALVSIINWSFYYLLAIILGFLLRSLDMIVLGWSFGILVGVCMELYVVLSYVKKYPNLGHDTPAIEVLHFSLPVLFSSIITYGASYADRFIVAGLLNLENVAVYNFALIAAYAVTILVIPINNILLPKLSEYYSQGNRDLVAKRSDSTITILSAFYVPFALGVAVLSGSILRVFAGSAYASGAIPLTIILLASAAFVSTNILSQEIAAIRKTRAFLYSSSIALTLNIVLSFVLVPRFGLLGAAVGYSSVYVGTFLTLRHFTKKWSIFSINRRAIAKIWFASVIMALCVYFLQFLLGSNTSFLFIFAILGSVIYLSIFRTMSIFSAEEKEYVVSVIPANYKKMRSLVMTLMQSHKRTFR